jgi:murein DD-endopeptidase MepM/ murein hydrolase activator NlpD
MRVSPARLALVILTIVALGLSSVAVGAESEVQQLQAQIRELQGDVNRAGDAYSDAYWKLEKTRDRLAALDKEIAAATAQLDAASARLSARAVQMYRSGGVDYLAILLSTDDFDEMLLRLEYVTRVGRQDADLIAEVTRISAELRAKRGELEKVRQSQDDEAARLKKESDRVTRALNSKQAEYNALQKKLKAAVARESGGSSSGSRYPPGPNGMVFPVAGPCYYQDTWGAARSGGRSHQGTDIMAKTGTPLVACVSGTVRSKYHSLGGNSIWLTADNGWAFYYAHLSEYVVRSGRVEAGQVIGKVGSTGNATAPHLHFEIHPNGGAAVNPYPYLKAMQ